MEIDIYCELNWAVERPMLSFYLNGKALSHTMTVIDTLLNQERVIYKLKSEHYTKTSNSLDITLSEKTDDKITSECDHWVSVKDIAIDNVRSNWMLFKNTVFKHNMSEEWVNQMIAQGYDIQPEYTPGSDLRLNGTCTYKFELPFWEARVIAHQKMRTNKS